ncbi:putative two component system response regulator [Marinobacter adhaerens HP15]|uniref:Putative two component system response regulator n=1 Tax=Marinobacter adhaerens (strain DSM 23420 / HP15) TaxID=225937 RepID=E4PJY4_MARAH|nr:putative two component system response regulator [Marinobacter adhaerens HP15]
MAEYPHIRRKGGYMSIKMQKRVPLGETKKLESGGTFERCRRSFSRNPALHCVVLTRFGACIGHKSLYVCKRRVVQLTTADTEYAELFH